MKRLVMMASLWAIAFTQIVARQYNAESERWLTELDQVIGQREQINEEKRVQLQHLQTMQSGLSDVEELFDLNSRIYDECFTFDSELAMNMVDANLQIAAQQNNREAGWEWQIKRSFVLASTGQLLEASKALEQVPVSQLTRELKLEYYSQWEYLYSHMEMYSWSKTLKDEYKERSVSYNDSIYQLMQPSDANYLWWKGWHTAGTDEEPAMIAELKSAVEGLPLETRRAAMLNYLLANLLENQGETDLYLQYMSRSAIADIRAANQDIASLEELSTVLYRLSQEETSQHSLVWGGSSHDLSRAYTYINVCLETSRIYNNLVRTVSIARVMDDILRSYRERDHKQHVREQITIWVLAILFVILLGSVVKVWRQKVRISQSRSALALANDELSVSRSALSKANEDLMEANAKLKEAMERQKEINSELEESNYVKEEYVGYVFSLCSNYISKMDEWRKNINRKAKVKLYDEILQMSEKSTLVQDELKEFYQNFDAIFLHIYPDFIQDFNSLLQPEERIEPRKGELLNTDLRIYALVRLGITDSVKIADFLHCSPQTVYNNRLKIRNKAIVPKENFADYVRALGRTSHSKK